jgi:hypothetical protein
MLCFNIYCLSDQLVFVHSKATNTCVFINHLSITKHIFRPVMGLHCEVIRPKTSSLTWSNIVLSPCSFHATYNVFASLCNDICILPHRADRSSFSFVFHESTIGNLEDLISCTDFSVRTATENTEIASGWHRQDLTACLGHDCHFDSMITHQWIFCWSYVRSWTERLEKWRIGLRHENLPLILQNYREITTSHCNLAKK